MTSNWIKFGGKEHPTAKILLTVINAFWCSVLMNIQRLMTMTCRTWKWAATQRNLQEHFCQRPRFTWISWPSSFYTTRSNTKRFSIA
jgi:hypothetical protein